MEYLDTIMDWPSSDNLDLSETSSLDPSESCYLDPPDSQVQIEDSQVLLDEVPEMPVLKNQDHLNDKAVKDPEAWIRNKWRDIVIQAPTFGHESYWISDEVWVQGNQKCAKGQRPDDAYTIICSLTNENGEVSEI